MSSTNSSFTLVPPPASLSTNNNEIDSLPSTPTTTTSSSSSSRDGEESDAEEDDDEDDGQERERNREGESDAEREWKESLQQLELLLTMVVVPYVGKYFGRRCAVWGWSSPFLLFFVHFPLQPSLGFLPCRGGRGFGGKTPQGCYVIVSDEW